MDETSRCCKELLTDRSDPQTRRGYLRFSALVHVDGDGVVDGAGHGRTVSSGHWRLQRLVLVS